MRREASSGTSEPGGSHDTARDDADTSNEGWVRRRFHPGVERAARELGEEQVGGNSEGEYGGSQRRGIYDQVDLGDKVTPEKTTTALPVRKRPLGW